MAEILTRQQQIEATRAGYRAAIQRAEKLGETSKVHVLEGALKSLERQWEREGLLRRTEGAAE